MFRPTAWREYDVGLAKMMEAWSVRRILVLGRDPNVLGWLRDAALGTQCVMEQCDGSAEALRRLRRRAFDVVLTSPRATVDGNLALLREMRRIRPGIKAIVLAPAATPDDVIAALRANAFAYFSPPFDGAEVTRMLAQALEADDWQNDVEVLSARRDWITLRVSCRRLTAERLVHFMDSLRSDLPDQQRDELILAFREMLMNAMEHGAGFDPEKVVEVQAVRTARAIVFHFRDPGAGFSIKELPHAAVSSPEEDPLAHVEYREARGMRPGGFGILLARKLVNELIYNERGNEVVLIKHML